MENFSTFVTEDAGAFILPLHVVCTQQTVVDTEQTILESYAHYAFICCCQGKLFVECCEQYILLEENQALIVPKACKIKALAKNQPCHLKIITYDGSGVQPVHTYLGLEMLSVLLVDPHRFDFDFRSISFDVRTKYNFRASLSFQHILYEIINAQDAKKNGKNIEIVNRYIMENYCSSLEIQTLAEIYGTSVSYLCREFKQKYRMSPMAYVNQLRIDKAREMLASTHEKVADIALACGFINTEYFCYVFKKYEHCTPLQYRNRQR